MGLRDSGLMTASISPETMAMAAITINMAWKVGVRLPGHPVEVDFSYNTKLRSKR